MKILIYAHMFPPSIGGMQISNLEIAKGLFRAGHQLEVIACDNKGAKEFISGLNFPVRLLPKWPFSTMQSLARKGLLNWLFAPYYFFIITYKVRAFDPDVILVADETANCIWGLLARRMNVPYVSYCSVPHLTLAKNTGYFDGFKTLKYKLNQTIWRQLKSFIFESYKHAALIIAVSNSTKRELCQFGLETKNKIHVVPRSIDDSFFQTAFHETLTCSLKERLGISQDNFVLLTVANLGLEKGIADVMIALSKLRATELQNIKYILVGEGSARPYLEELALRLNLKYNVIFAGAVQHVDIIPYYDLCDLFILPSRKGKAESFGRVFAEAAARGKPCIGVNDGGMIDVIEDGRTGFLIPVGDRKEIRERIKYLMDNLEIAKKFGVTGRDRAKKKYRSNIVAHQIEQHLKYVVNVK